VLGRLRVAQSTASVEAVVSRLARWMLLLGGALLTLSLVALWRVSGAISRPLIGISEVMRRFTSGERGVRALVTGPTEARTISGVYNQLIEAQEAQARELERQVEERTHQWREASAAAQEAERYKSTFMAHVSHEMKTPLHIIHSPTAGYFALDHDQRNTVNAGVEAKLPWQAFASMDVYYGSGFSNGEGPPSHLPSHAEVNVGRRKIIHAQLVGLRDGSESDRPPSAGGQQPDLRRLSLQQPARNLCAVALSILGTEDFALDSDHQESGGVRLGC
jgi:hypothetical protein